MRSTASKKSSTTTGPRARSVGSSPLSETGLRTWWKVRSTTAPPDFLLADHIVKREREISSPGSGLERVREHADRALNVDAVDSTVSHEADARLAHGLRQQS